MPAANETAAWTSAVVAGRRTYAGLPAAKTARPAASCVGVSGLDDLAVEGAVQGVRG